ncbi:ABC-type multidrug transport system fused ATPase/permease subunit [Cytobacillus horneckiae]|uniref:hypothetical protein n=1 Tax=Cytobacillus horneckiae TaxID=549687 RepID=UPI000A918B6A|nr:hypothetical protein [Cytobacillus horneckiae]NRG44299.1 hypothetical protein [Bacillus sp. CRN 9]MBN6885663.1 hypothetical protein [Cytobacillus horneckiae]MCM3177213.1 hypothetical protein [Cytobacillus horneckiae]MEC1156226.1 hypothetical protein [Cytobacillus horneckiae]MED2938244.1 hypothetical protein [Cytobacillus horneckiae]
MQKLTPIFWLFFMLITTILSFYFLHWQLTIAFFFTGMIAALASLIENQMNN